MPVLIVHEIGKEPTLETLEGKVVTIGRSPDSDVLLLDPAVSRLHAMIRQSGYKEYLVKPAGKGNIVVVNGKEIKDPFSLREGAEIRIGPVLLIFSMRSDALSFYRGTEISRPEQKRGPLDNLPAAPLDLARDTGGPEAPTAFMDAKSLRKHHELLRASQKAWIQNVSPGPRGEIQTLHLKVEQPCLIGKGRSVDLRLKGLTLGLRPTVIRWKEEGYEIEHSIWYPSMNVNGSPCKESPLADGDLIQIGSNLFRFRSV